MLWRTAPGGVVLNKIKGCLLGVNVGVCSFYTGRSFITDLEIWRIDAQNDAEVAQLDPCTSSVAKFVWSVAVPQHLQGESLMSAANIFLGQTVASVKNTKSGRRCVFLGISNKHEERMNLVLLVVGRLVFKYVFTYTFICLYMFLFKHVNKQMYICIYRSTSKRIFQTNFLQGEPETFFSCFFVWLVLRGVFGWGDASLGRVTSFLLARGLKISRVFSVESC